MRVLCTCLYRPKLDTGGRNFSWEDHFVWEIWCLNLTAKFATNSGGLRNISHACCDSHKLISGAFGASESVELGLYHAVQFYILTCMCTLTCTLYLAPSS